MADTNLLHNTLNIIRDTLDIDRDKSSATSATSFVNNLNNHIGSRGASVHNVATISPTRNGFMSTSDYDNYTSIPEKLAELQTTINNNQLPSGTCVWYYGLVSDIPSTWELVSSNANSSYYEATQSSTGTAIHGMSYTSTDIGEIDTISGKIANNPTIETIALYLIRKK